MSKYHIPVIVWMVFILILSLLSPGKLPHFSWSDVIAWDKVAHVGFYMVLAVLLLIAEVCKMHRDHSLLYYLCIGAVFGTMIECLQYLSHNGRHFELADIVANILGMFLGVRFFYWSLKKFKICGAFLKKY